MAIFVAAKIPEVSFYSFKCIGLGLGQGPCGFIGTRPKSAIFLV